MKGNTLEQDALTALASAKTLSLQLGVTYKQVVDLIRTGFVNPQLNALVVLDKLGVEVADVFTYKNNEQLPSQSNLTKEQAALAEEVKAFKAKLEELSQTFQGFDAVAWLDQSWQQKVFDKILVLADPDTGCNFDLTTLRHADGTAVGGLLRFFLRPALPDLHRRRRKVSHSDFSNHADHRADDRHPDPSRKGAGPSRSPS